ncbi:hypothetical protein [Ktedonobacter robiniae]|uniref:Uncharacterized protein n=1 Tax=Ktedonobacter robiniae TaxID=2778365 RepID=A0ABQ3V0K7_9CHLR|nr:hypothetical protein [Ktedonobacter robiniae]GHO58419.1 hypothetical protein KSB_68940 [Ktedonobacter robiniae]
MYVESPLETSLSIEIERIPFNERSVRKEVHEVLAVLTHLFPVDHTWIPGSDWP